MFTAAAYGRGERLPFTASGPNRRVGIVAWVRAFVIGGTGAIGTATARRLLQAGWQVQLLARGRRPIAEDLARSVQLTVADRSDTRALRSAFGAGADLLVDCLCFTAADARVLLGLARDATSTVMISSKAVYVDAHGRHVNSPDPPRFTGPISETQPTVPAGSRDHHTPEGYGQNKVAAERVLLDSGLSITVLRASKIHGRGASPARSWVFVKRILDRRPVVLLAGQGRGLDHPSAAANIARLIETVAARPGSRILNAADPDTPDGLQIAQAIAQHVGYAWTVVPLADDAPCRLGWHPWDRRPPITLETSAAAALGYTPAGDFAATIGEEVDWLIDAAGRTQPATLPRGLDDHRFEDAFDYQPKTTTSQATRRSAAPDDSTPGRAAQSTVWTAPAQPRRAPAAGQGYRTRSRGSRQALTPTAVRSACSQLVGGQAQARARRGSES